MIKLENHIVTRLLTDKEFWIEICMAEFDSPATGRDGTTINEPNEGWKNLLTLLRAEQNKTYYVANTVMEKLPLLDSKKCMDIEGWKIFKSVPDFKNTFILPTGNTCIRVMKVGGFIYFCHFDFQFFPKEERTRGVDGNLNWVLLYVDLDNGVVCDHFKSNDGQKLAPFLYTLMCYVKLCDNEIRVVEPKQRYGTQKSGKIVNTLPFPITVINNNWNVTTITSGGFAVSGHCAIRWTGSGRVEPKLVYIQPFTKEGYVRKAGKDIDREN